MTIAQPNSENVPTFPRIFSQKDNPTEWLEHYEKVGYTHCWNDKVKRDNIIKCLGDDTRYWYINNHQNWRNF
jgi:hypothetical protein